MRTFDIGLSALTAHQQSLMTSGQNISNASTPGYHRQQVRLVARPGYGGGPLLIGAGVDVASIQRVRNQSIEAALWRTQSEVGAASVRAEVIRSVENLLTPGDASLHARLSGFFDAVEQAANAPADITARRALVTAAQNLSNSFASVDRELSELNKSLVYQLQADVDSANRFTSQIAAINHQIAQARGRGGEPNDLLDRRDQLVSQLAELVDVALEERGSTGGSVRFAGGAGFIGTTVTQLRIEQDAGGNYVVTAGSAEHAAQLLSGRLQELLVQVNEVVPQVRSRLATLASQLVQQIDTIHAAGLPNRTGLERLASSRSVSDIGVPLAQSGLPFPVAAGNVYVTVTEIGTGVRRTYQVSLDPQADSLQDVADRLDALPGLAAFADPQTGKLTLIGEGGYAFDFAGRMDSAAAGTPWTGTSQVSLSGVYNGAVNDEWHVSVTGTGTIGVTPGLTAEVRDSAGQLIASLDIGEGYEGGKPLPVANGLSIQFSPGTVTGGEAARQYVIQRPDETGVLAALGINTLFEGSGPAEFAVSQRLLGSASLLSLSRSGEVGEALNAERLLNLRTALLAAGGTQSFVAELAGLTGDVGLIAQSTASDESFLGAQLEAIKAEQQAVSGVNPDEEMLKILESQRAFQAAAKYLTTVNDTLQELMQLLR